MATNHLQKPRAVMDADIDPNTPERPAAITQAEQRAKRTRTNRDTTG